jgi:hypothetical protein
MPAGGNLITTKYRYLMGFSTDYSMLRIGLKKVKLNKQILI